MTIRTRLEFTLICACLFGCGSGLSEGNRIDGKVGELDASVSDVANDHPTSKTDLFVDASSSDHSSDTLIVDLSLDSDIAVSCTPTGPNVLTNQFRPKDREPTIQIDQKGITHILFYNSASKNLEYATNPTGTTQTGDWVFSTIESLVEVGRRSSLSIDSNGVLHASYHDETNGDLKYATNGSGSWVVDTVDSAGYVGSFNSISADSDGSVHLGYYDFSGKNLKYTTNRSGSWVPTTIDSPGDVGRHVSLAIDGQNNVHLGYRDDTNEVLKYANNAGGSWSPINVDSSGTVRGGYNTSIVVDQSGKAHIVHSTLWGMDNIFYSTNSSGIWTHHLIEPGAEAEDTQIQINSDEKLYVAYITDTASFFLKSKPVAGGTWITEHSGSIGFNFGLAIDSLDKIHLSYIDGADFDYYLFYRTFCPG